MSVITQILICGESFSIILCKNFFSKDIFKEQFIYFLNHSQYCPFSLFLCCVRPIVPLSPRDGLQ